MKAAFLLLAIALPATYCFYLQPNLHHVPTRVATRNAPLFKSLGDFFHRLHLAAVAESVPKRCINTFDESCANGDIDGAGSDDDWLDGDGNNPGRR